MTNIEKIQSDGEKFIEKFRLRGIGYLLVGIFLYSSGAGFYSLSVGKDSFMDILKGGEIFSQNSILILATAGIFLIGGEFISLFAKGLTNIELKQKDFIDKIEKLSTSLQQIESQLEKAEKTKAQTTIKDTYEPKVKP